MSLQDTPSGERIHIAFFGKRNAGKSSLVNAVTGQELSVVSEVRGTTTDPVQKSMELLPLGPVVIIDTPGFDDEGDLGALRVKKAREVLRRTDLAVLVTEGPFHGFDPCEEELLESFRRQEIPYLLVCSKCDRLDEAPQRGDMLPISAHRGGNPGTEGADGPPAEGIGGKGDSRRNDCPRRYGGFGHPH